MFKTYNLLLTQTSKNTPTPGESQPIDFSDPFELIVFIILPILVFIIYFVWIKRNKRKGE